jgi:hypothetical protein
MYAKRVAYSYLLNNIGGYFIYVLVEQYLIRVNQQYTHKYCIIWLIKLQLQINIIILIYENIVGLKLRSLNWFIYKVYQP